MSDHPNVGTCNEATCGLHGFCHCGCGTKAAVWPHHTQPRRGYVHGQPTIYRAGHHPKNLGGPGCYSLSGIDADRLLELVRALVAHHGSIRRAALAIGMPSRTLHRFARPCAGKASPTTARAIVGGVQALRHGSAERRELEPIRWDNDEATLPAAPLLRTIDARFEFINDAARGIAEHVGVETRSAWRWITRMRQGGVVPISLADAIATACDRHPTQIWGTAWEVA